MYPMADSSPQGGRDYEMMVMNIVDSASLPGCISTSSESRDGTSAVLMWVERTRIVGCFRLCPVFWFVVGKRGCWW